LILDNGWRVSEVLRNEVEQNLGEGVSRSQIPACYAPEGESPRQGSQRPSAEFGNLP